MRHQFAFLVLLSARAAADSASGHDAGDPYSHYDSDLQLLQVNAVKTATSSANALQQMTDQQHKTNRSTGPKAMSPTYGEPGSCNKLTLSTCFVTGQCDKSRNAVCTDGFACTCGEFMCHDGHGGCRVSPDEIKKAVSSGLETVQNVIGKFASVLGVTRDTADSIVHEVLNTADVVSTSTGIFEGAAQDANSTWNRWMHKESKGCSRFVDTCFLFDCPRSVAHRATCSGGLCKCNPGYCYARRNDMDVCIYDIRKIIDIFLPGQDE